MGCFGYICKGCKTPINGCCTSGGEKCILIHVRHGEELGRVEGHYDEYGRVVEQQGLPEGERYRGHHDGINGHSAICDSEFSMGDSLLRCQTKGLPTKLPAYSGTIAWHSLCYSKASAEEQQDLTPSDIDPDQSWGRIRKKYC